MAKARHDGNTGSPAAIGQRKPKNRTPKGTIMNAYQFHRAVTLAAFLTSASGAAFADGLADSQAAASNAPGASVLAADNLGASRAIAPLSRGQVKAEARLAELTGQIPRGEAHYPGLDVAPRSSLTRAEVKAATRVALAEHLIARGQASFPAGNFSELAPVSRADVKAETRYAEQHGLIPRGESNLLGR
jgi:hypothetical protein